MARFYLAVIQAVLLYGSESWVISQQSRKHLETFHNRCARHMAHRHIRFVSGVWEHPSTTEVLDCCRLSPILTYIAQRKERLLHTYAAPCSPSFWSCLEWGSHNICSNHHPKWWQ